MKRMMTACALLLAGAVAVTGQTIPVAKNSVTESICSVIRKHKHDEKRVVIVVRCYGAEDFGIVDADEESYRRGGLMMQQFDDETKKEK